MTLEWPSVPLSDLTIAPVTYGIVQPGAFTLDGVPMLRVNNFQGHSLNLEDVSRVSASVEVRYERTRLQSNDVLLTIVGSVGQVAIVPPSLAGWNIARAVALIRPREPELSRWISFFLRSPKAQHLLGTTANTTVQTTINLKDLRVLQIPMPDQGIRDEVCKVLSSLDDRINNLRQANATLEAIGQVLFNSWFVDFDPVRAKAEGREPEGMNAATAALFPSEFEDSELGPIPQGWQVDRLGNTCRLNWGNTSLTKKSYVVDGFRAYSAAGQDGYVEVAEYNGVGAVISAIGTVGKVHLATGKWTAIKNTLVAMAKTDECSSFTYHQLRLLTFPTRGSTQQFISQADARSVLVVMPTRGPLEKFGEIALSLIRRRSVNEEVMSSLEKLRDTLLPRLISGKLRLPDAEALIKDVTA